VAAKKNLPFQGLMTGIAAAMLVLSPLQIGISDRTSYIRYMLHAHVFMCSACLEGCFVDQWLRCNSACTHACLHSSYISQTGAVELPAGWAASTTEDGREYYYNIETKASQFQLPEGAIETAKAKAKRINDQVLGHCL